MKQSCIRGRFHLNLKRIGLVAYSNQKGHKQDYTPKNERNPAGAEDGTKRQCYYR